MDQKRFDDRVVDRLLAESLACDTQPDGAVVAELKRSLAQRKKSKRSLSLWWLPALSGTAVSACFVYALSFVADWKCLSAVMVLASLFTLSAWSLTLIGICKFESFKEACKLI
jgi:hypothetical protein